MSRIKADWTPSPENPVGVIFPTCGAIEGELQRQMLLSMALLFKSMSHREKKGWGNCSELGCYCIDFLSRSKKAGTEVSDF